MSDLTPGQRWTDGPPPTVSGDALPPAPPPQPDGPPPGGPPPGGPPPPTESYPLPEPQPPRSGDNNIWLILTGVAVIVLLLGAIIYVVSDDDDEGGGDGGGLTAAGNTDGTDGTDPGGLGNPSGTDDPGGSGDDTTSTTTTSTTTSTTTTVPVQPAQAQAGDCIAVTESGSFLGADSCDSGGTPYRVKRVVDANDTCPNQNHGGVVSGDFQLCVEFNIRETYCYVFPRDPNTGGIGGWVTPASACEAAGTVHVIDVVPGATESDQGNLCTSEYQWNYWYEIRAPQAVVCVMEY